MVKAGTRDEQPKENGMAHYIEHCVFKGTAHHSSKQIIRNIEGIGGEVNAYTTKEETTFYAATLTEHIPSTLRLLSELVFCPTFPKEETDKECGVIIDEIESYNDSPSELIYDDFENLLFRGHPLAMPILGTRKTLRYISANAERPRRWMQEHYSPEKMVVFCQGNIQPKRFVKLVEGIVGGGETTAVSEKGIESEVRECVGAATGWSAPVSYRKHTHQTHVMLGARAYPIGHEKQLALYLMNNILGGGSLNSRLNLALRESRGLVYTIESTYTPLSDTGYWSTYFACEPQHLDECMTLVRKELQRCVSSPLSHRQLSAALKQLRGQMAISAQNQENNALSMAKSMLYRNYAPTWQETYKLISEISPKQLQEVASEVFASQEMVVLQYV